ncbi:MAG: NAD(P)-binding protein [Actinomycetota bacterium]|nr:NAD(P)-binding protein [Actinomycetota bacterium]MDA2951292.1 NAD(P)-binding protein [Actinomycetota bacterium]
MRVGIVGAGIAGLACAEGLSGRGHEVVVFDKGRGPGGRMSTRRFDTAQGEAHFDHGAQYFTVRDPAFQSQVSAWVADGVVAPWTAAGSGAYVGVPGMNSPVRELADHHDVNWSALVTGVERHDGGLVLRVGADEVHDVDLVVIAVPAEQAAALLAETAPDLAKLAGAAVSEPCWTVMAAFSEPVAAERDCWAGAGDGVVGWAARNNAKPGRTGPESWVVQATPAWSRRHIDADSDAVTADLLAALSMALGVTLPTRIGVAAHLWRFARSAPGGPGPILDPDRGLGLCGDWLIAPRVESGWLSGTRLAERIGTEWAPEVG